MIFFANIVIKIELVLIDVDGTLIRGKSIIPTAPDVVHTLKSKGFPFALLTNDGTRSPEEKSIQLKSLGIEIERADVVSCADAIFNFVEEKGLHGKSVFVMGNLGVPCYAQKAGLYPTRKTQDLSTCAGVIVGEANYQWESTFNAVINFFIHNPKAFLLVPNPDTYWSNAKSEINIGAGGKARFITSVLQDYGISIEPIYLGKPNPEIFKHAIKHVQSRYGLSSALQFSKVFHIGDSLQSDVKGAKGIGLQAGLVLTGVSTLHHVHSLSPSSAAIPDFVFETM